MLIENLTWQEFERALSKTKTIIIPIGPLEQHGPHLPLGTDFIHPYEIAKRVAEKIDVFVHPPIPLGGVNKGRYFPGSINIHGEILENLVSDICKNLIRHGINKILFLSGHSSSFQTPYIIKSLEKIFKEYQVKVFHLVDAHCSENVKDKIIETQGDKHAGESETSMMLELREDLVKTNKLSKEFPPIEKVEKDVKNARKYWKTGVCGDATKATKQKGEKLIEEQIKYIVNLLTD